MKIKKIIPFIIFIALYIADHTAAFAQDKIYKTDSTIVEAKVIEIGTAEIKYKKYSNQDGPVYTVSKTKVLQIVFENGEKEVYNTSCKEPTRLTDFVKKDSVQFIEELWGVKFQDTQEDGGIVRIVKLEGNSIFRQQVKLSKLAICNVNNGALVRVKTSAELARILFKTYDRGISKVNLLSSRKYKLSYLTFDPKGIDIAGISKFQGPDIAVQKHSPEESKIAGTTVSGIYHPGTMWGMQGFCSGMMFGLPGIGIMGVAAMAPPKTPTAPANVDAVAWAAGYKAKIKKKRLVSGVIGSVVGCILVIAAFTAVNS